MKNIPFKKTLILILIIGVILGVIFGHRIGLIFTIVLPLIVCAIMWMKVLRASNYTDNLSRRAKIAIEAVVTAIITVGFWFGAFGTMILRWAIGVS